VEDTGLEKEVDIAKEDTVAVEEDTVVVVVGDTEEDILVVGEDVVGIVVEQEKEDILAVEVGIDYIEDIDRVAEDDTLVVEVHRIEGTEGTAAVPAVRRSASYGG